MDESKKTKLYKIVSVCIIIASLLFSIFHFEIVAIRFVASLKDFGLSVLYYAFNMAEIYGAVEPTVTVIPSEMPQLLPITYEEFKEALQTFWILLKSGENFSEYCTWLVEGLVRATPWIYFLLIVVACAGIMLWLKLKPFQKAKRWVEPKREKKPTKPLRVWLWLENKIFSKITLAWKSYKEHLKGKRLFKVLFFGIWLYNFNAFTIAFELLAYIFYAPVAMVDSLYSVNLYSQVVKLVLDLSVVMNFLPLWLKLYFGVRILEFFRTRTGDKRVKKKDDKNGQLLEDNQGTILITGKPRAGKGLVGTDMVLKQEVKFREDAKSDMRDCRVEFPFFPWDRLERFMLQAIDKHVLYTKEGTRDFIEALQYLHEKSDTLDEWIIELMQYRLKKFCGYDYDDYIFGYDAKRYGTSYNNGIVMIGLFETLIDYAQLYFVYDAPTSLVFSTQGVRIDFKRKTLGYFPKYDLDSLKRKPEEIDEISTYSHKKNADSERLGRRINPDDPIVNGYEVAVAYEPEIDKERGNQNTNAGMSASDDEVNPKNDLYGVEEKMHNHICVIRYRSYYRKVIDTQRNGAVSSDTTEMTLEFQIKETKKEKVTYPFFGLEKDLFEPLEKLYNKLEEDVGYLGDTRTLFAHLIKRIYTPFARRIERLTNRFGTQDKIMRITNGQNGELIESDAKWTVIYRRAKAKRYATDGVRGLYRKRVIYRSQGGLNDFELFDGIHNTDDELISTNSRFYKKFPQYFNGEYEAERQRVKLEKELREREKQIKEKLKEEKKSKTNEKPAGGKGA